jgi:uncharacterized protein YoxC
VKLSDSESRLSAQKDDLKMSQLDAASKQAALDQKVAECQRLAEEVSDLKQSVSAIEKAANESTGRQFSS